MNLFLTTLTALVLGFAGDDRSAVQLNDAALSELDQGNLDEAIRLLDLAVSKDKDDSVLVRNLAVAHNNRGLAMIRRMEFQHAIHDFERATRLVEDEPLFQVHLAFAHMKRWDLGRAEQVLLGALRKHEDEPKVLDHLGFVYYARDELSRAIDVWRRRLKVEDDEWARGQLEKALREQAVSGDFIDKSSNDFTLKFLGSDSNLRVADGVLRVLEDARAKVCGDLGFYPQVRTTVLLYNSVADFKRATGSHDWVGGLYDGKIRLPVVDFDRQREVVARTARHEYTHRVLHELVPECPIWLNEGLAEWFERGVADFHADAKAIDGEIPAFAALPESFASEKSGDVARRRYAASRSFVAFLLDRYGLGALRSMLMSLRRGDEVDYAARRSFGSDLAELEAIWRREILER